MPVAVCPECCRDYYLAGEDWEDPRCERCGCLLVWAKAVEAAYREAMRGTPELGEDEVPREGG
jgi:hypothetical protein